MTDNEYITPNYETISVKQKRDLFELMNSSLLNAFNQQDFLDVLQVFQNVIDRLEKIETASQAGDCGVLSENREVI